MKKILLIFACVVLLCSKGFAEQVTAVDAFDSNFVKTHTSELLNTIKLQRVSVYSKLDLNEEQIKLINNIDEKRYSELEPELVQLSLLVKKLEDIANSENCTMKSVKAVKKEFKPVQNNLFKITKKYEKELTPLLTREQLSKYKYARKQVRNNIKQDFHKK